MRFCVDMDGTVCSNKLPGQTYTDVVPIEGAVDVLREMKAKGHYIILYTARGMLTYKGNLGEINKNTLFVLMDWLKKYEVPYDEVVVGKPHADYFIDDKAVHFKSSANIRSLFL